MPHNPLFILVDVGGIDNKEEIVVSPLVDKQIVDYAPVVVQHHAVETLAVGGAGYIVGKNAVDKKLCIFAGDAYFAHVAYVEHTAGLADSAVLRLDACGRILYGHIVAGEGAHGRPEGHMQVVQAGFFKFIHGL